MKLTASGRIPISPAPFAKSPSNAASWFSIIARRPAAVSLRFLRTGYALLKPRRAFRISGTLHKDPLRDWGEFENLPLRGRLKRTSRVRISPMVPW